MKKLLGIVFIVLLAGCTSGNYSEIDNSQAVIKNLKVEELGVAGSDKHQLDVKFDYSINDYHDISGLYTCSVLFASSQNKLTSKIKNRTPCKIDANNGAISFRWDTPLSTNAGYSSEEIGKLIMPIKYHVAIHQNKTSNTNVIIGMSEALYLSPKT